MTNRQLIRAVALVGLGLILSACSGTVHVPPTNVTGLANFTPTPGRYAAMIQSGGWVLNTKPDGFVCGAWTFKTDINKVYEDAMREVLTRSLEKVDFVPTPVTPTQLAASGYDAFFAVQQGNADSKFGISQGFFSSTANSNIELASILAITDERGSYYQQTITGKGAGTSGVMFCPSIEEAIASAAQDAVRDIAKSSVLLIRDGLSSRQLQRGQPKAQTAPTASVSPPVASVTPPAASTSPAAAKAAAPQAAAPANKAMTTEEKLTILKSLRDQGLVTPAEYEQKRQQIIAGM